jgi:YidC/Oxa1 family membrane protein insertase
MDIRRVVLYAALLLVTYSLWTNWQVDYPPQLAKPTLVSAATPDPLAPPVMGGATSTSENPKIPASIANQVDTQRFIAVTTDVLKLTIDLQQGDVVGAQLLKYSEQVDDKTPFVLLKQDASSRYVAASSLFTVDKQTINPVNVSFSAEKNKYTLQPGQNSLLVTLTGATKEGLRVSKQFEFKRDNYLVTVRYVIDNSANEVWKGYMNTQLLWQQPKEDKSSMFHMGSYTGASYSNPGHHRYQKVDFKDMAKTNLEVDVTSGWLAMQQHYFLSAWIPVENSNNRIYTRAVTGEYIIGAVSAPIEVATNQQKSIESRLYLGPEDTGVLKTIAPGLDLTADYGWLWFLSLILLSFLKVIYGFVGNWGWSIVLVTLFIKLMFYRLSATSYKSMANMRKLQPKLQALRERFGEDKAKISQATMELYRQEKVNPLGGCLPILIQIPVFIALYWVLMESVELRQAPFILWINDLSSADPYHVLPVLMGITMLTQQRLNPAPPDPMQAKVMMFFPVLFTAILWNSPAGLVLYWTVQNTLSILQQWHITRKFSDDKPKSKKMAAIKNASK